MELPALPDHEDSLYYRMKAVADKINTLGGTSFISNCITHYETNDNPLGGEGFTGKSSPLKDVFVEMRMFLGSWNDLKNSAPYLSMDIASLDCILDDSKWDAVCDEYCQTAEERHALTAQRQEILSNYGDLLREMREIFADVVNEVHAK